MNAPQLGVRVPASTSNVGAGFDCLGIALDLYLTARLVPGPDAPVYGGTLSSLRATDDIMTPILGRTGLLDRHALHVTSDIPLSRGLGSSAAARAAATALAALGTGRSIARDAVFTTVAEAEGHPDNAAPSVYGGAQLVVGGTQVVPVAVASGLGFALAVPEQPLETRTARDRLPESYSRGTAIRQAGRLGALVLGLERGDAELIRLGMEDELAVPFRRELIPGFDAAVRAALASGAHGATISGAGSALFAIAPAAECGAVAAAMAEALTAAGNRAVPSTPSIDHAGLSTLS